MPDRSAQPGCSVVAKFGRECGNSSLPDAPFPICIKHASRVLRYLNSVLTEEDGPAIVAARDLEPEVRMDPLPMPGDGFPLVYYVRVGRFIKIGHTINLTQRFRFYPPDTQLLAYEPGDRALEQQRLREFRSDRRGRREWFEPTDRLRAHVAEVYAQMDLDRRDAA